MRSPVLFRCFCRLGVLCLIALGGCRAAQSPQQTVARVAEYQPPPQPPMGAAAPAHTPARFASYHQEETIPPGETGPFGESSPIVRSEGPLSAAVVIQSVHATFPLLEAAYQEANLAAGKQTAAWGAFDAKLKAASENGPLGFYETYRHSAGVKQPIYNGGEFFGGYRVGRGEFQPWYQERQTNDGGEFKAGVRVPLLRDREIDARRADLWRANYDQQRAQPEIRGQLILFVRDARAAYWKWLAAAKQYEIGRRALELAQTRNDQLRRRDDAGDIDPPILQDALRSIAKRENKLLDLRRKFEQAGYKLALYYRAPDGSPIVPGASQVMDFPQPAILLAGQLERDLAEALRQRPELAVLEALRSRAGVDLAEARNDMLPALDAQLISSQDVGAPTSKKRDKSPLELEAGLFVDVPVQRRKARGKMRAAEAKLSQIAAKLRFTQDKIAAELRSARAAAEAAYQRLGKARESKRLAEFMAETERRKFELGQSDLLAVALREQYAIEAAEDEVQALLEYFTAQADYDAATGRDWPQR